MIFLTHALPQRGSPAGPHYSNGWMELAPLASELFKEIKNPKQKKVKRNQKNSAKETFQPTSPICSLANQEKRTSS